VSAIICCIVEGEEVRRFNDIRQLLAYLTRFTDHAFFRGYNKLMMNLSRLGLDSTEKKNLLPRMGEFDTVRNELIFPLEQ
jgi:hypothetical protein